ncbi:cAMP-dependent protein kinase inhibitor alpha isoform X2 [Castor canadensis]|uniref:cAMP-dependent protein kinase inhibitor alpha isoform X2 n=1 Tax=Castor canadensis TaxID=51338 RepID=A0AC58M615_CASCN
MRPELGGGSGSCSWQVGPGPARSDHAHGPAGAAGLQRGQRAPGTRRDSIRARLVYIAGKEKQNACWRLHQFYLK